MTARNPMAQIDKMARQVKAEQKARPYANSILFMPHHESVWDKAVAEGLVIYTNVFRDQPWSDKQIYGYAVFDRPIEQTSATYRIKITPKVKP